MKMCQFQLFRKTPVLKFLFTLLQQSSIHNVLFLPIPPSPFFSAAVVLLGWNHNWLAHHFELLEIDVLHGFLYSWKLNSLVLMISSSSAELWLLRPSISVWRRVSGGRGKSRQQTDGSYKVGKPCIIHMMILVMEEYTILILSLLMKWYPSCAVENWELMISWWEIISRQHSDQLARSSFPSDSSGKFGSAGDSTSSPVPSSVAQQTQQQAQQPTPFNALASTFAAAAPQQHPTLPPGYAYFYGGVGGMGAQLVSWL